MNEKIRKVSLEIKAKYWRDIFVDFMEQRFPDEQSIDYILTWKKRFDTGEPSSFMDKQSDRIYRQILFKHIGDNPFSEYFNFKK